MRVGEQTVKKGNRSGLVGGQPNDLRGAAEKACKIRHEGVHRKADELGQYHCADNAEARPLFCPAIFPRTEVLAGICRERHRKARDRQKRKALELAVRAAGCDGDFAEGVDICLHDHVCKADDGVLNAGGKAIADDLPEHFAVDAEFCPMQVVFCRFFRQLRQAQNDADGLRDDGCDGSGPDAPAKAADEQNVQNDVCGG